MIIIIEGPDGTGKTSLATEIQKQIGAHVIHCTYNKYWDIGEYHYQIMEHALRLHNRGIHVILDRWAPSEHVYGKVFRKGESYDTNQAIAHYSIDDTLYVYCRNDNAVENHLKNKTRRDEMFESMAKVSKEFDKYSALHLTKDPDHVLLYDFDKFNRQDYVKTFIAARIKNK